MSKLSLEDYYNKHRTAKNLISIGFLLILICMFLSVFNKNEASISSLIGALFVWVGTILILIGGFKWLQVYSYLLDNESERLNFKDHLIAGLLVIFILLMLFALVAITLELLK